MTEISSIEKKAKSNSRDWENVTKVVVAFIIIAAIVVAVALGTHFGFLPIGNPNFSQHAVVAFACYAAEAIAATILALYLARKVISLLQELSHSTSSKKIQDARESTRTPQHYHTIRDENSIELSIREGYTRLENIRHATRQHSTHPL